MIMRSAADLAVDVVRAAPARFRHPLLLIHGLWTGSWIWRDFAGHLGNRGWESWVPSMLRAGEAAPFDRRLHELRDLCRTMAERPVIIAHDAGVALATVLARDLGAPAVVAVSPWVLRAGGRLGYLREPHFRAAALFAARLAPPRAPHPSVVGVEHRMADLVADSGPYFRSLFAARPPAAGDPPGLVITARGDSALPVADAERFAADRGWAFDVHESAGHFPMLGRGSERLADRVHRWMVRATGREMLLWDEEGDGNG